MKSALPLSGPGWPEAHTPPRRHWPSPGAAPRRQTPRSVKLWRVHPRRRAGPPDRRQPQPGGGEAERHRAAFRRPAPLRGGERPPRAAAGPGRRGSAEADPPVIGKVGPRGSRVCRADLLPVRPGPQRGAHRPAPRRRLAPPRRAGAPAARRRPPRLPSPQRPAPAAACGARRRAASTGRSGTARSAPPLGTGCCRMTSGRRSPATSCTAPAWPLTARRMTRSAGSRSGTPRTTSTSSRCWPARTAGAPAVERLLPGAARRAGPPRNGSGCGGPRRGTGPRPAARPARRPRRPGAAAVQEAPRVTLRRAVSTAAAGGGQRAGVLRPAGQAGIRSASGSAPATLARSPATPSRCPVTPPARAARSGSAAGSSRRT